jgi:hypothetical protein
MGEGFAANFSKVIGNNDAGNPVAVKSAVAYTPKAPGKDKLRNGVTGKAFVPDVRKTCAKGHTNQPVLVECLVANGSNTVGDNQADKLSVHKRPVADAHNRHTPYFPRDDKFRSVSVIPGNGYPALLNGKFIVRRILSRGVKANQEK